MNEQFIIKERQARVEEARKKVFKQKVAGGATRADDKGAKPGRLEFTKGQVDEAKVEMEQEVEKKKESLRRSIKRSMENISEMLDLSTHSELEEKGALGAAEGHAKNILDFIHRLQSIKERE